MSTRLFFGTSVLMALACGCRTEDEAGSERPDETRLAAAKPRRPDGTESKRPRAKGEYEGRGVDAWRQAGARGGEPDDGAEAAEDPLRGAESDQQRQVPRTSVLEDELAASMEIRSLPDGVYDVERTTLEGRVLWRTQEDLEAFLEEINARESWVQIIRIGPWRIRVIRDPFFDPYRRDSGWIDIDELDGQR